MRCIYKNATCSGTQLPCVYGNVDVETALAVSSDAFFYRIGELMMTQNNFAPVLQEQVELFGFGADTGIELPFEFNGTVPDDELKKEYADLGVISEDEGQDYFTGDNVQLAIGQGLLSASPLQLAVGYSAIANYGFVMKPEIIMAIYQPGVPDSRDARRRRPLPGAHRRGTRTSTARSSARSRCRRRSATRSTTGCAG